MADRRSIRISNERDAWAALEHLLNESPADRYLLPADEVLFDAWPFTHVEMEKVVIDGSISPPMMEAFIEWQKALYRAHTLLTSGTGDLRTLSNDEKERFKISVRVSKGSSVFDVDWSDLFEKLGKEAINHMSGADVAITVITVALLVAGVVSWKAWLAHRVEMREKENSDQASVNNLEMFKALLDHSESQGALIARAASRVPMIGDVEAISDNAKARLLKAISEEGGAEVDGVPITQEVASEINSTRREYSSDVEISGFFRVAKVETTLEHGFRVTFSNLNNDEEVVSTLQDALLSSEHRAIIQKAEWSKTSLYVKFAARRLKNKVIDAVVNDVREESPSPRRVRPLAEGS